MSLATIPLKHPSVAALENYRSLMLQIGSLAQAAAAYQVPSHYKAQAEMIGKLAALKLTRIVGEADGNDAIGMAEDLRDFGKIVDPFLAEIGSYCSSNFNGIDQRCFTDVLTDAMDGFAIHTLERAGERRGEDLQAAE